MDFTYDDEQDALRDAVKRAGRQGLLRLRDAPPHRQGRPGLRREGLEPDGRDGPAGPALQRGRRRRRRRPGRDRHRVPRARPRARPRALPRPPWCSPAAWWPRSARPEQRGEILGALSSGESVLAFAHDEPGHTLERRGARRLGAPDGDGNLTGVKDGVLHGARADVLVVSAALPDGGTGLFVVTRAATERDGYPTIDGGRAARDHVRRHRRHAAGRGRPRRHRQHRHGAGHHPHHGRQPGPRGDADAAARRRRTTSRAASSSASRSTRSRL